VRMGNHRQLTGENPNDHAYRNTATRHIDPIHLVPIASLRPDQGYGNILLQRIRSPISWHRESYRNYRCLRVSRRWGITLEFAAVLGPSAGTVLFASVTS
jgi:hypothetical protein